MPKVITWQKHRGRVAGLSRDRAPDDPELVEARRDLAAVVLEDRVRKVLTTGPPLTAAQRSRIADLLLNPPPVRKARSPAQPPAVRKGRARTVAA